MFKLSTPAKRKTTNTIISSSSNDDSGIELSDDDVPLVRRPKSTKKAKVTRSTTNYDSDSDAAGIAPPAAKSTGSNGLDDDKLTSVWTLSKSTASKPSKKHVTKAARTSHVDRHSSQDEINEDSETESEDDGIDWTLPKVYASNQSSNSTSPALSLHEVVDDYMFRHINLEAPAWYVSPHFGIILGSDDYTRIAAATPLTFAPGLSDVLQSAEPPSPDFFMSTPKPEGRYWAVYAALLVKEGCEPALSIGSGTDAIGGYKRRIKHYDNKKHPLLPRFVRIFYDRGYDLAHIGALCWSPIPRVDTRPRARLRFLGLEGTFSNLFYSVIPTCMDALWTSIMPWRREDVLWRPANSHTPFNEGVGPDLEMSDEQLLRQEQERKRRDRERYRLHGRRQDRERYERDRAADIEAYRLTKRDQARSWVKRNKSKALAASTRCKNKARKTRKFSCKTCNKAFTDKSKLTRHNKSQRHRDMVNGRRPTAKQKAMRTYSSKKLSDKCFYCVPCDHAFDGAYHLKQHKLTKRHLDTVARINESSVGGTTTTTTTTTE